MLISSSYDILTHLRLEKIAAIMADNISKLIFLNENGRIPTQISLKFIPKSPVDNKLAYLGSGNSLAPNRRQAITWTNDDQVHLRIYATLGGDELIVLYDSVDTCRNINTQHNI